MIGRGTTFNGQSVTASTNTTNSSASSSSSKLKDVMMYATTPHMFHEGEERCKFNEMCTAVKRPLYGADCYAYAILASGFGAELVVEADLGLYDYCALVPVVEGAGGIMTDWMGRKLTLHNHELSKGRVVACANAQLHQEAIAILGKDYTTTITPTTAIAAADGKRRRSLLSITSLVLKDHGIWCMVIGIGIGIALSRPRGSS